MGSQRMLDLVELSLFTAMLRGGEGAQGSKQMLESPLPQVTPARFEQPRL